MLEQGATQAGDGAATPPDFLAGGGEMGAIMRAHDWGATALGPPAGWPQALRTALRLILNTGHPMYVYWGPELLCFYNDAYRRSLGPERHPGSLGRPGREVWAEIWPIIGPEIERALRGEGASRHENHLVPVTRNSRREEAYWTYSYGPIDDPASPGGVGGALVVCTETTEQVRQSRRAREVLREREERLRMALDAAGGIGTWDWDVAADLVRADARFCRFFGVDPRRGAAGVPIAELVDAIHPDDRVAVRAAIAAAVRDGGEYAAEYRVVDRAGQERWVSARGRAIADPATGRTVRFPGVSVDITGRSRMEEALRRSETRARALLDAVPVGVVAIDLETLELREFNARVAEQLGYAPEEMRGFTLDRVVADRTPEELRARGREIAAMPPGTRFEVARRQVRRDGAVRDINVSHVRVDLDGRAMAFGAWHDVTEQRAAEAALARSERRYRSFVEASAQVIWRMNARGEVDEPIPAWCAWTGQDDARSRGMGWLEAVAAKDRPAVEAAWARAVTTGDTYEVEYDLHRAVDRAWRRVVARAVPVRDGDGGIVEWIGTCRDVTEQRAAEAELAQSRARLAMALEGTSEGLWDWDVAGGQVFHSPRWIEMLGIPPGEWRGAVGEWLRHVHPDDVAGCEAHLADYLAGRVGEYRNLFRMRHRDGSWRWMLSRAKAHRDADGRVVRMVGTHTDVTAQREAEARLRESEARYRALFGAIDAGFGIIEMKFDAQLRPVDYRLVEINPAFERQTGLRDAVGRWVSEAVPGLERHWYETYGRVALTGEAVRFENYAEPFGRWYDVYAFRTGDPQERRVGVLFNDITARKAAEAELRRLNEALEMRVAEEVQAREAAQARLAHAQRMEALGQLAGGIAHDFNNVLQAVAGAAKLMERRPGEPGTVQRLSRMIGEAAERGASVTRRLLAFSRRGDLRTEAIDPALLVSELREVLAHSMGGGIGVVVEVPRGVAALLADKGQLETVLINLAANARDAMGGKGVITLSAAVEMLPDGHACSHLGVPGAGRYVRLSVADTGEGMTPEVLARVSEPFFTTKGLGKGTGLGLAMARGFAEQSGGGLHIDSAPGMGTTVTLWFPVAQDPGGRDGAARAGEGAAGGAAPAGATVLVADDEALVREVVAEGLRAAGYRVREAGSGAEALGLLDEGAVDLHVADLSMPGMDGLELVASAQRRRPALPAILLTGFATNAAELALSEAMAGTFSLMRKPVSGEELAERVAVLLHGREAGERG